MLSKIQKIEKVKSKYIWDDCFCGGTDECRKNPNPNRTFHSHSCKLNHQHNKRVYAQTIRRRIVRANRKANHQCIYCVTPITPKLVYHQACECCRTKYRQKGKEETTIIVSGIEGKNSVI